MVCFVDILDATDMDKIRRECSMYFIQSNHEALLEMFSKKRDEKIEEYNKCKTEYETYLNQMGRNVDHFVKHFKVICEMAEDVFCFQNELYLELKRNECQSLTCIKCNADAMSLVRVPYCLKHFNQLNIWLCDLFDLNSGRDLVPPLATQTIYVRDSDPWQVCNLSGQLYYVSVSFCNAMTNNIELGVFDRHGNPLHLILDESISSQIAILAHFPNKSEFNKYANKLKNKKSKLSNERVGNGKKSNGKAKKKDKINDKSKNSVSKQKSNQKSKGKANNNNKSKKSRKSKKSKQNDKKGSKRSTKSRGAKALQKARIDRAHMVVNDSEEEDFDVQIDDKDSIYNYEKDLANMSIASDQDP